MAKNNIFFKLTSVRQNYKFDHFLGHYLISTAYYCKMCGPTVHYTQYSRMNTIATALTMNLANCMYHLADVFTQSKTQQAYIDSNRNENLQLIASIPMTSN